MDVESEIRDLKRRVGELEGSFGFLTGQVREVHRSLLSFQEEAGERLDRVEQKVDVLDRKVDGLDRRFDELPRALAEVVRAEFDRRDRQA